MSKNEVPSLGSLGLLGTATLIMAVAIVALPMWGCPRYSVWQQGLAGEAKLKEAESSRRIAIEEAKAKLESAKMLADAEKIQAQGVADANRIIADGLAGPGGEAYLRYLWIKGLNDGSSEVIYVPTEANLPILEAGKRKAVSP